MQALRDIRVNRLESGAVHGCIASVELRSRKELTSCLVSASNRFEDLCSW